MKYKKIASFIKKRKYVSIHKKRNEQWISDGFAAYPIIGMRIMSEDEILRFLDFQQNDNITVTNWTAEDICLDDTDKEETYIKKLGPSLMLGDTVYMTFYTELGALLVKEAYIAPCYSHYGEGELSFWLRFTLKGTPYIAVKKGLILLAAILPEKTWGIGDHTLEQYLELCNMIRLTNGRMKDFETESEDKNEQTTFNGQTNSLGP